MKTKSKTFNSFLANNHQNDVPMQISRNERFLCLLNFWAAKGKEVMGEGRRTRQKRKQKETETNDVAAVVLMVKTMAVQPSPPHTHTHMGIHTDSSDDNKMDE